MDESVARIASLEMAIEISAPVADVWAALTESINQWWPDSGYGGGAAGSRRFVLEARPGGLMYEEYEGGGGLVWGTVTTIEPGKMLQILGDIFPNWGGPSSWYGTWQLEAHGSGTKLSFSESAFGRLPAGYLDEKTKGWDFLWGSLKAHLEGTTPPVWSD